MDIVNRGHERRCRQTRSGYVYSIICLCNYLVLCSWAI